MFVIFVTTYKCNVRGSNQSTLCYALLTIFNCGIWGLFLAVFGLKVLETCGGKKKNKSSK